MNELEDESVQVTITSPPYRNAIDYAKHLDESEETWYRGAELFASTEAYISKMCEIFQEVRRVTRTGGFLAIVVGNELDTEIRSLVPLPALLMSSLVKDGPLEWKLQEEIIWNKVTGGKKRFRVTVQHPYPTYYYSNIMHEHIIVLRKGPRSKKKKIDANKIELDDLWKKDIANSCWHIAPVPPNSKIPHPCPFPDEIPRRLILCYSGQGDTILDPFCGSGTTTRVAHALDRVGIGYDTSQEYCDYAEETQDEGIYRSKNLIPRWEKI